MSDPHGVALGARLLAIETTLRALVEQAAVSAPDFRDRVRGMAEDYLSGLRPDSALERDFAQRAREFTEAIVRRR